MKTTAFADFNIKKYPGELVGVHVLTCKTNLLTLTCTGENFVARCGKCSCRVYVLHLDSYKFKTKVEKLRLAKGVFKRL